MRFLVVPGGTTSAVAGLLWPSAINCALRRARPHCALGEQARSQQARLISSGVRNVPLALLSSAAAGSSASPGQECTSVASAAVSDGASTNEGVRQLRELLDSAGGSAVVLTGAGISTDSGIPDYRGPKGSYSRGHKPLTHDQFLSSEDNRKRYWARSIFGWDSFSRARPNAGHAALAKLESMGKISDIITQNVDGLHQKAGSMNVVDLHGKNDMVECMSCGYRSGRNAYQADLARRNAPWLAKYSAELGVGRVEARDSERTGRGDRLRADGDADLEPGAYLGDFIVPACPQCGGFVKNSALRTGPFMANCFGTSLEIGGTEPTVVFFGDNIPRHRVEETYRLVDESRLLIAAGSSLQVYSAFRLVKRAADAGKQVAVVNRGETRAERSGLDVLKVEAGVSSVFTQLL